MEEKKRRELEEAERRKKLYQVNEEDMPLKILERKIEK